MNFIRNQMPIMVAFIAGVVMIVAEFIPREPFGSLASTAEGWFQIISAFAMILGILSLLLGNLAKIQKGGSEALYPIVTLVSFFVTAITGIVGVHVPGSKEIHDWIFNNMYIPLQATMFSMLAFYVASAAFRAFKARTPEATLLLVAAGVVMLGRVPIGEFLGLNEVTDWIMAYPNTAGQRAIMIGIALGIVSTSLRVILGIERSYMGGD